MLQPARILAWSARVGFALVVVVICFGLRGSAAVSAVSYERCLAADNSPDGIVDVVDSQREAAHYGGEQRADYDPRLDIDPVNNPDGDIDIQDLQRVFGYFGLTCAYLAQPKQYWMGLGGMYSYEDGCADGGEIDPVTTVFRRATDAQQLHAVLVDIGLTVEAGSEQDYRDNGGCAAGEISLADDDGTTPCFPQLVCATDRWHVRANNVSSLGPAGGY